MLGKVETYNPKKKYGFIHGDDGRKYYVSEGQVRTRSRSLDQGMMVSFTTELGEKGWKAGNVRLI